MSMACSFCAGSGRLTFMTGALCCAQHYELHLHRGQASWHRLAMQVCASTACFGFVSEITHEQFFTAACIILRAVMGELAV